MSLAAGRAGCALRYVKAETGHLQRFASIGQLAGVPKAYDAVHRLLLWVASRPVPGRIPPHADVKGEIVNKSKIRRLTAAWLAPAILLAGCATTPVPQGPPPRLDPRMLGADTQVNMEVNGLAAPGSQGKGRIVYITSALRDVSDEDLQFQEVARLVENALAEKGFVRSEHREAADQLVRVGYGIGAPEKSTQTVTTSAGYSYPVGWMWFTVPPTTQTVESTSYNRTLIVESYDLREPGKQPQLWKTIVTSEGSTGDLRRILPFLVVGSMDYYGVNTGQQLSINVNGNSQKLWVVWK